MPLLSGAVLLFAAGAVLMDLRGAKVNNGWILFWLICSLDVQLSSAGLPALQPFFSGMLLPFIFLFPFFLFRMLGAGDIKVLAVLGSMMGPGAVLRCLFATFLIGAMLSAALFLSCGGFRDRMSFFLSYLKRCILTGQRMPYLRPGIHPESLHMTVPVFLAAMLWAGGLY